MSSLVRKILFDLGASSSLDSATKEEKRLNGDDKGRSVHYKATNPSSKSVRGKRQEASMRRQTSRRQFVDEARPGLVADGRSEDGDDEADPQGTSIEDNRGQRSKDMSKSKNISGVMEDMSLKRADRLRRLLHFQQAKRERAEEERKNRRPPFKVGICSSSGGFHSLQSVSNRLQTRQPAQSSSVKSNESTTDSFRNCPNVGVNKDDERDDVLLTQGRSDTGEGRGKTEEASVTRLNGSVVSEESTNSNNDSYKSKEGETEDPSLAIPEVLINSTASLELMSNEHRSQAQPFHQLLNDEKAELTSLCSIFEGELIKNDSGAERDESVISESVREQIRVTVGKAKLLMNEKGRFTQFFNLIQDFEYQRGQKVPNQSDLQGFWELISIQSDEIKASFSTLKELKSNNWNPKPQSSTLNVSKSPYTKKSGARKHEEAMKSRIEAAAKPTASLRAMIMAKRRAMKQTLSPTPDNASTTGGGEECQKVFDGGFFNVQSPIRGANKENRRRVSATGKHLEAPPFISDE